MRTFLTVNHWDSRALRWLFSRRSSQLLPSIPAALPHARAVSPSDSRRERENLGAHDMQQNRDQMLTMIARGAVAPAAEYDGFIGWVLSLMTTVGEIGVGLAILIENFVPPIPSEAVLPGAGFLAYDGRMNVWWPTVPATPGGGTGPWTGAGLAPLPARG